MEFMKYFRLNPPRQDLIATNPDDALLALIEKQKDKPVLDVVAKINVQDKYMSHFHRISQVERISKVDNGLSNVAVQLMTNSKLYSYSGKFDYGQLLDLFSVGSSYYCFNPMPQFNVGNHKYKLISMIPCASCTIANCKAHFEFSGIKLYLPVVSFLDLHHNPDLGKMNSSLAKAKLCPTPLSRYYVEGEQSDWSFVSADSGIAGSGKTKIMADKAFSKTGLRFVACNTNADVKKFSERYSVPVLTFPGSNRLLDQSSVFSVFLDDYRYQRLVAVIATLSDKSTNLFPRKQLLLELSQLTDYFSHLLINMHTPFVGTLSAVNKFYNLFFRGMDIDFLGLDECTLYRQMDIYLIINMPILSLHLSGDLKQEHAVDILDKNILVQDDSYDYSPSLMHWFVDNGVQVNYIYTSNRFSPLVTAEIVESLYSSDVIIALPNYVLSTSVSFDDPLLSDYVNSDFQVPDVIDGPVADDDFSMFDNMVIVEDYSFTKKEYLVTYKPEVNNHSFAHWNGLERLVVKFIPDIILTPYVHHVSLLTRFAMRNKFKFKVSTIRTFQGNEANSVLVDCLKLSPFFDDNMYRVAVTRFTHDNHSTIVISDSFDKIIARSITLNFKFYEGWYAALYFFCALS